MNKQVKPGWALLVIVLVGVVTGVVVNSNGYIVAFVAIHLFAFAALIGVCGSNK